MKVPVSTGRFRGLSMSLWDLLHSEYVSVHRRRELAALCLSGRATALRQVVSAVTALVEASERQPSQAAFRGLRKQVSARDLFRSQLIDKKTLHDLNEGRKTVQEVTEMDSVKRFLEGGNFIAGVLLQDTKERMSISEALRRHVLRPGTALVLLEAQAATGFLIDPLENRKLTVQEAFEAGMFGKETYQKLLSAERAVTGYTDPYTGEQISLFQAMKKGLIVREHGIRLLEAQIATGGVIDPVHSHRVPVDVAFQRGYFDEEMSRVLEDPSDDTRGFFDPNTHENLTYMQLLERCVRDPDTGLYLLQVVKKGEAYVYIDEATKQVLQSKTTTMRVGRFANQMVSFWDLLTSQYFTEDRKRELVQAYRARNVSLEQLLEIIVTTVKETEKQNQVIKVAAIGGEVTAAELFNSGIIDKKTLDTLHPGDSGGQALRNLEPVKAYLDGRGCIAGVTTPSTQEVLSMYEAGRKGLVPAAFVAHLLEAQAATGFMLDPYSHQRLSVDEAVAAGLVGEDLQERLLIAEKAARGYVDPVTGHTISLFQAMRRKLVAQEWALRLLEVQVATGGVVDPLHHHRLPLDAAYRRGCLHPDTYPLVADPKGMNKRYVDPNTQEKVTYQELQERSQQEEATGWALFPVLLSGQHCTYIDDATIRALQAQEVEVTVGRFKGQRPSVWELLNSEYVTEEKKRVLSEAMLGALEEGRTTADDVTQDEGVRRYLEGTSCIAGVLVPARDEPGRQEKMSIYQAMWKGVLRPGTALVLLEAQAATGFVVDPVRNRKLSVEEAVAAGVVGGELQEKLLSAERAVTGYTDPYTGEQISLFQAMKKDLIVREHGIRLLEAQIATGGVIDPVHSHRVPVDVAFQRGYFDEEMSRVLEDPSDDTRGFFDPNTHENLTYKQLHTKRELVQAYRARNVSLEQLLEIIVTTVKETEKQNQVIKVAAIGGEVTAAELFNSGIIDKKTLDTLHPGDSGGQALRNLEPVKAYLDGRGCIAGVTTPSTQEVLSMYEAGRKGLVPAAFVAHLLEAQAATGFMLDPYSHQRLSVDEAVAAGLVGEDLQERLLIAEKAARGYVDPVTGHTISLFQAMRRKLVAQEWALRLLEVQVATGGVVDPLHHHRLPLDAAYRRGCLHPDTYPLVADPKGMNKRYVDPNTQEKVTYQELQERSQQEEATGWALFPVLLSGQHCTYIDDATIRALQAQEVEVTVGRFKGQRPSVWELLNSEYVTEEKKRELVVKYKRDTAHALEAVVTVIFEIIHETEKNRKQLWFRGIRRQITAAELCAAGVLSEAMLGALEEGRTTADDVTQDEGVRRYLEGTSCIAGVLVPARDEPGRQEKMSIYQAMWKGVLRPGTALVLLEAQAATGFVVDPVRNRKLSVEEAVAAGVVGGELQEKLLSAERAVTGYTDPYTGEQISLFQAMKKDLIVREHGIRLLEAQIATGGVIDPVHSHRVPVDVAFQRGYFDEEMSRVLEDPSDDTRGFFDPNTHENLTYKQLLQRGSVDPETGLLFLSLS
ncbi:hypothetical protein CB1_001880002 [Camelus ferus]|nr:hypothetical protein CB1_001880002 [Camelus ferus]